MSKQTPYIFARNEVRSSLQKGKENAISRQRLKQITGMDDRTNRNIIKDLRIEGTPVISVSSEKGYWLPEKNAEVEHCIKETKHRIKELTLTVKGLEAWLKEHANDSEYL